MSKSPRVTRMVLFKHGVAYLERSGPAEGEFELSFKRDEMNDVLKSLAVWVASGDARVGAVGFEAPEDPEAALAKRKLTLSPGAALQGLLTALRGRIVSVDDGAGPRQGEVLGIERVAGGREPERQRLLLRTEDGTVALVDLADVRSLTAIEAPSRADLEFLVDRFRAATSGESRTVRIALDGRAEDLRVAYVIPAPIWRVSYRISMDGADTLLVAWGIVHNPADEDLEQVELTLTTGEPVSFVIDLYQPRRVERAVVEETIRAGAAPTKFERARPAAFSAPQGLVEEGASLKRAAMVRPAAPAPAVAMAASFAGAADGASLGVDRGELFEYRVLSKVSLKRGGSAMVPLVAAKVDARKERIWREGAGRSPDIVLTFENGSGAVLEEGPAVLYDEATYAGEAMVPYSARGAEVKLAFAKDLAIRCNRDSTHHDILAGVRLGAASAQALMEEHRREEHHTLSAESDHAEEVEVVFELPRVHGRVIHAEGATPVAETASFRRFALKVPPHGNAKVIVRECWTEGRHVRYDALSAPQLEAWLAGRFLDRATFDALRGVLLQWEQARTLDAQRERAEKEQKAAYAKQEKLTQQLAVLKDTGPEGALRVRYVKELEAEQNKVNAAEADMGRLRDQAEAAGRTARSMLDQLTSARG